MLARNLLANAASAVAVTWIVAVLGLNQASAQEAQWFVSEVTGGAKIEGADGSRLDAKPDITVSPGARVTTDKDGHLRLTNGASVMTLSAGTEIELRAAPEEGGTSVF